MTIVSAVTRISSSSRGPVKMNGLSLRHMGGYGVKSHVGIEALLEMSIRIYRKINIKSREELASSWRIASQNDAFAAPGHQ